MGTIAPPPKRLCLNDNLPESIEFFDRMRISAERLNTPGFKGFVYRDPDGGQPRITSFFDFGQIDHISTAAAIVLAAEYERMSKLYNEVPPTVNLDTWNEGVFRKLYQLGFFEIVGLSPQRDDFVSEAGTTRTMRIVSSQNADDLAKIDISLQKLGAFLNPVGNIPEEYLIDFLTGLSEAISNVTNHAYPDDWVSPIPHIGGLWVAATANRSNNSLTIAVYDQGATIPVTYPRIDRLEKVLKYLTRTLRRQREFDFQDDGTYIRAAMRYGGSRTDQKHRGKGLPQMLGIVDKIGATAMSVFSRGGWCRRSSNGRFSSGALPFSIGGTLIEWVVELPIATANGK